MDSERYRRGWDVLQKIDPQQIDGLMAELREIAPDFAKYVVEFPFGDIYSRPGLDLQKRELVAVAALTTLGNALPQLKVHIRYALKVGCAREEVLEVTMQTAVYAGFPAALNGLFAAREVFRQDGSEAGPGLREKPGTNP